MDGTRHEDRVRTVVAGAHDRPALVDGATGACWTYGRLGDEIDRLAAVVAPATGSLVVLRARNDVATVVAYLACQQAGVAVLLLDDGFPADSAAELLVRYRPALVLGEQGEVDGYAPCGRDPLAGIVRERVATDAAEAHPDLGLLLTTSGSTGSPKLVRLATSAVVVNARSIAAALGITPDDVAPTSLPLHYSYGLSILNSHLAAGATVVVTGESLVSRRFWELFDERRCTSLAGVPYSYQLLTRLRFRPDAHPSLRTMTQAGGRLGIDDACRFWDLMDEVGGRFHVMYGQTEATARMAVMPHDRFRDKPGSAGLAVPGGRFEVLSDTRQLVYTGPNVMMGYAIGGADLWKDDELRGRLYTGDLGHVDDEGFVFLTGRAARFAKVFGVRVSLDDVEDLVRSVGPAAAVGGDDRVVVFTEGVVDARSVSRLVADRLRVHVSGVDVRERGSLPLLPNGKIDYRALEAEL